MREVPYGSHARLGGGVRRCRCRHLHKFQSAFAHPTKDLYQRDGLGVCEDERHRRILQRRGPENLGHV